MKRQIIIFRAALIALSLFTISCSNPKTQETNDLALKTEGKNTIPDLYYGVDARFAAVSKSDVYNATSIFDFLNEGEKAQIEQIYTVDVIVVKNNQLSNIRALGTTDQLTEEQLEILKTTDYFSHFTIRTEFKGKNRETGKAEDKFFSPHITVVPEQQAAYVDGKEALLTYLKKNSKESMKAIKDEKLGAIKLSFIIDKHGKVTNVKHDAMTTGYPSIDKKLMQLLENIPGKWIPAENANGEKMDYEFVFTFGPRDGC